MLEQPWIDYTALPRSGEGFSQLFTDYITDFPKLQSFFTSDFRKRQHFSQFAEHICKRFTIREELVKLLASQHESFGGSARSMENIQLLAEPNTVAIVTGQQVSLLGGPLYTVYKTLTAIKLSEELNATIPEFRFVPVFWLESEDHDFAEMNHIGILNPENQCLSLEYHLGGAPVEKNIGAIGEVSFDDHLLTFFERFQNGLVPTEFRPQLLEMLQKSYAPGISFSKAFTSWLNSLFPEAGLVFISSNDKNAKQLLKHIFIKEINEFPAVTQRIIAQSAKLEDEYHAQIKPRALNLFCFHKGGRYLLEPREHDFSLKGTRQYFTKDELLRFAEETPEFFSPNVALRPICQDTLLPTLAYIAGPSEIAYFAQLKAVYEYFNLEMPIIYPRASATILEQRHLSIMDKYNQPVETFFNETEKVAQAVLTSLSEVNVDDLFAESSRKVYDMANELKFGLEMIDPTLLGTLEHTQIKIEEILLTLKNKAMESQRKRHEIALRQVYRVSNAVFPEGTFQERFLNIAYFMNKYGLDFPKRLSNELLIDQFKHQLIVLT
ncbi:MAG: bacillithiol biosynthesis cysteine-adding enzyme BshC [Bacteroidetes bacterium]|nr:MAG: bacillithiol biosynthesis cysteine-adding enzyme BshC [Bacteroidota bacterium]